MRRVRWRLVFLKRLRGQCREPKQDYTISRYFTIILTAKNTADLDDAILLIIENGQRTPPSYTGMGVNINAINVITTPINQLANQQTDVCPKIFDAHFMCQSLYIVRLHLLYRLLIPRTLICTWDQLRQIIFYTWCHVNWPNGDESSLMTDNSCCVIVCIMYWLKL